jgi:hypothetical protein
MMKKIYYEKKGRRYVPVAEYDNDLLDSFPKGAHLVMCYPGGSSRRFNIDPNYAAMIAAGRVAEDAICENMRKVSEAKPKKLPITERQRAAWEEMKDAFGDEFFSLTLPASRDLAEAGVKAMQLEADKLMSNESVRKAYEQFQLICELTKENNYAG